MIRQIIKIDEDKCNGCGLCAKACHEGAIGMINGKAKLLRDDYCDGLGDCLPVCPTQAISFEKREAANYNEDAVKANAAKKENNQPETLPCGCPGTHSKTIRRGNIFKAEDRCDLQSQLNQWPVQIKLVPVNASYFNGANLLVSADCVAYAYANFHSDYMKNKITIIGCPKLDEGDYSEKLTAILKDNDIKSVTVARMEVPCCGGIENAVKNALKSCGKLVPWSVITFSTEGRVLE